MRLKHFIYENPSLMLIAAAMIVSAPRYVDAFASAAGWRIISPVWEVVHASSGGAMAILESVSLWFAVRSLSLYRKRDTLSLILIAINIATFISLALIVTPTIYATSQRVLVSEIIPQWFMWLWAVALMAAPLLIVASSGIAEHLRAFFPVNVPVAYNKKPVESLQDVVDSVMINPIGTPKVNHSNGKLTATRALEMNPSMSNKEIAALTGTTESNVRAARKRIALN